MTERLFRFFAKMLAVTRAAQRTGACSTHACGVHVVESLSKASQALQRSLPRWFCEVAVGFEAFREAHGFTQPIDNRQLAVA